jgi:hypothetical protein
MGTISLAAMIAAGGVSGCADASTEPQPQEPAPLVDPEYKGIETLLLDDDLVNFRVAMTGARDNADVARYGECAAAQYALIRGYGFARHVRTNVIPAPEGGTWRGDAVYVISASLPDGLKKLDAEVVAADCAENGIPMV